jgi:hypothetical protein
VRAKFSAQDGQDSDGPATRPGPLRVGLESVPSSTSRSSFVPDTIGFSRSASRPIGNHYALKRFRDSFLPRARPSTRDRGPGALDHLHRVLDPPSREVVGEGDAVDLKSCHGANPVVQLIASAIAKSVAIGGRPTQPASQPGIDLEFVIEDDPATAQAGRPGALPERGARLGNGEVTSSPLEPSSMTLGSTAIDWSGWDGRRRGSSPPTRTGGTRGGSWAWLSDPGPRTSNRRSSTTVILPTGLAPSCSTSHPRSTGSS